MDMKRYDVDDIDPDKGSLIGFLFVIIPALIVIIICLMR